MFGNNTEQLGSHLKDMAILSGKYFVDLQKQGFDDEQAFKMVIEMQKALFGVGVPKN